MYSKKTPPLGQSINISVKNMEPMDIVKTVLEKYFDQIKKDIESETSYRKIHEVLVNILDSAEEMDDQQAKTFLKDQLSRAYVIIKYQKARDQINDQLSDILIKMINELSAADVNNVKELIRRARLLVDSIAVIAKEVG